MEMLTVLPQSPSTTTTSNCKRKSISSSTTTVTSPIKVNKKLPTTITTPSKADPFNIYKPSQEKHVKEWDWKSASQTHYSTTAESVSNKFLQHKQIIKKTKSTTPTTPTKPKTSNTSTTTTSSSSIIVMDKLEKDKLEQTVIDAGQKNVGQMICSKCKMLYSYGSKEDEAAHNSFCSGNIQQKIIFKNHSYKVIISYPNGHSIIVVTQDDLIDNQQLQSKITSLKSIINDELDDTATTSSDTVNNKNKEEEKVFLYLDSTGRVIGSLFAERVNKGYRIESLVPTIECTNQPTPILCGVDTIWVLPSNRNKGIASKLMNTLCSNMIYCHYLKKHEIAITQPSSSSLAFFLNYFSTDKFLLYNINK